MHGRTLRAVFSTVSNSYTSIAISQSNEYLYQGHSSRSTCCDALAANDVGWSLSATKRILDAVGALVVLAIFAIPMLLIAILVRLTSNGPAVFVQKRVGFNGRLFRIYKFRSMEKDSGTSASLTREGDERITPVGRWLRKFKLDELPQFYNVLCGDMSFVGPRPKLPKYAEERTMRFRPGITGAATILFRCEEKILNRVAPGDLDNFYLRRIKPLKERIDMRYLRRATFWSDLGLIFDTFRISVSPARVPRSFHKKYDSPSAEVVSMKANSESDRVLHELCFANSEPLAAGEGD